MQTYLQTRSSIIIINKDWYWATIVSKIPAQFSFFFSRNIVFESASTRFVHPRVALEMPLAAKSWTIRSKAEGIRSQNAIVPCKIVGTSRKPPTIATISRLILQMQPAYISYYRNASDRAFCNYHALTECSRAW